MSLTWFLYDLQLNDITGADFENSLYISCQSKNLIIVFKCFILNLHFGLQNANMSAQKKSSGGAGRNKVLPAGVDGVTIPSADENGGEDPEVYGCSFFDVLKFIERKS